MALPTDLFYNTGIATYVWLLTNRKAKARRGKVQLIDASGERFWKSLRKNLGSKRREIPPEARNTIVRIFHDMANGGGDWSDVSKIFDTEDFGYREWLCRKHRVQGKGGNRFPDQYLYETLRLVRLPGLTRNLPWAKA